MFEDHQNLFFRGPSIIITSFYLMFTVVKDFSVYFNFDFHDNLIHGGEIGIPVL